MGDKRAREKECTPIVDYPAGSHNTGLSVALGTGGMCNVMGGDIAWVIGSGDECNKFGGEESMCGTGCVRDFEGNLIIPATG